VTTADHCLRCGLAFSVRGCSPEACNNPAGAAEVERLRAEQAAMVERPWERAVDLSTLIPPDAPAAEVRPAVAPCPRCGLYGLNHRVFCGPSDLETLQEMLERAGIKLAVDEKGWTDSYVSLRFAPDGTLKEMCDPNDGHEGGTCPYCGL
jgi:hypothetical protein